MAYPYNTQNNKQFVEIPNPYLFYDVESGRPSYHKNVIENIKKEFESEPPRKIIVIEGYIGSGKTATLKLMAEDRQILGEGYIPIDIDSFEIKSGDMNNFLLFVHRAVKNGMNTSGFQIDELDYAFSSHTSPDEMKNFVGRIEEKLDDDTIMILIFTHFEELMATVDNQMITSIFEFFKYIVFERHKFRLILAGKGQILSLAKKARVDDFLNEAYALNVVGHLEKAYIEKWIVQPVKNYLKYDSLAVQEIIKITGGNLYCQQLLCYYLIKLLNKKRQNICYKDDVLQAMKMTIEDRREDFINFWNNLNYESQIVAAALADETVTKHRGQYYFLEKSPLVDIIFSKETLDNLLMRLINNNYINRIEKRRFDGNPYTIPLYGEWIRKAHPLPQTVVENWDAVIDDVSLYDLKEFIKMLPQDGIPLDRETIETAVDISKKWAEIESSLKEGKVNEDKLNNIIEIICNILGFQIESKPKGRKDYFTINIRALNLGELEKALFFIQEKGDPTEHDVRHIQDIIQQPNQPQISFFLCIRKTDRIRKLAQKEFLGIVLVEDDDIKNLTLAERPELKFRQNILLEQVNPSTVSPYETEGPATTTFYGRNDEIRMILGDKKRNFAIVGARRIGKSSLLLNIKDNLPSSIIPIYMELEVPQNQNYVTFLHSLEMEIRDKLNIELNFANDLSNLYKFIKVLKQKTGKSLIFLLDEIDNLLKFDKKHKYQLISIFRALFQEGYCQIILSGFDELYHAERKFKSPLYNFCEFITLGLINEDDALNLVTEPMTNVGIKYNNPEDRKLILEYASCHPNLLQFFCKNLIERIEQHQNEKDRRTIFKDDIKNLFASFEYEKYVVDDIYLFSTEDISSIEKFIVLLLIDDYPQKDVFRINELDEKLKAQDVNLTTGKLNMYLDNLRLRNIIIAERKGKYHFALPIFPELLKKMDDKENFFKKVKEDVRKSL